MLDRIICHCPFLHSFGLTFLLKEKSFWNDWYFCILFCGDTADQPKFALVARPAADHVLQATVLCRNLGRALFVELRKKNILIEIVP